MVLGVNLQYSRRRKKARAAYRRRKRGSTATKKRRVGRPRKPTRAYKYVLKRGTLHYGGRLRR